jgi:hypothetical protein
VTAILLARFFFYFLAPVTLFFIRDDPCSNSFELSIKSIILTKINYDRGKHLTARVSSGDLVFQGRPWPSG